MLPDLKFLDLTCGQSKTLPLKKDTGRNNGHNNGCGVDVNEEYPLIPRACSSQGTTTICNNLDRHT